MMRICTPLLGVTCWVAHVQGLAILLGNNTGNKDAVSVPNSTSEVKIPFGPPDRSGVTIEETRPLPPQTDFTPLQLGQYFVYMLIDFWSRDQEEVFTEPLTIRNKFLREMSITFKNEPVPGAPRFTTTHAMYAVYEILLRALLPAAEAWHLANFDVKKDGRRVGTITASLSAEASSVQGKPDLSLPKTNTTDDPPIPETHNRNIDLGEVSDTQQSNATAKMPASTNELIDFDFESEQTDQLVIPRSLLVGAVAGHLLALMTCPASDYAIRHIRQSWYILRKTGQNPTLYTAIWFHSRGPPSGAPSVLMQDIANCLWAVLTSERDAGEVKGFKATCSYWTEDPWMKFFATLVEPPWWNESVLGSDVFA